MVNKMILVGYLGNDPELRYTPSGQAVANFSIATTEKWKDSEGNKQEHTEWFRCVAWGKQAEILAEYAKKGALLFVSGPLRTEKWKDKDDNERETPKLTIREFQFLRKAETDSN